MTIDDRATRDRPRTAQDFSLVLDPEVSTPVADGLQELYDPVADEALPYKFGRVLGRLYIATSSLRRYAVQEDDRIG